MIALPKLFDFAEIEVLEVSHSSHSAFDSCERKLEFRKFHKASRKDESHAGSTGNSLHKATQTFLVTRDVDAGLFELVWDYKMKFQKSPMEPRSLEACIGTYLKATQFERLVEYEIAQIEKPDGTLVPAVEVPIALELKNFPWYPDGRTITVRYIMYIDLIMYSRLRDDYMVWDVKTTTKDTDMDIDFHFHDQCLPYGLGLEALLKRNYSNGFEIAYWVQMIDHLEPKNKYLPYMKSREDILDWVRRFVIRLSDIKRYYNMGWFPRRGVACGAFKRTCPFFNICETRDPQIINTMLAQEQYTPPEREEPWIVIDLDIGDFAA